MGKNTEAGAVETPATKENNSIILQDNDTIKTTESKDIKQVTPSFQEHNLYKHLIMPDQMEGKYQELLKSSWRIKGILPDDARLTVIYGQPKSYKSFLALDMALSVATGKAYHNRKTNSCNVLYIAAEGQKGILKRIKTWMQERNIEKIDKFYPFIKPITINDKNACNELIELLQQFPETPGLIFIDTLNRSLQGSENSDDMTAFVAGVTEISVVTGAQVVVIHHTPKTGEGMRGHSSLHGAVDFAWKVEKHKKISDVAVMTCDNAKDHTDQAQLFFNMKLHQIVNSQGIVDTDADGEAITSLVPIWNTELTPEPKRGSQLQGWKLHVFDALKSAIKNANEDAATIQQWREAFYSTNGNSQNSRTAFSTNYKELIKLDKVFEMEDLYFLPSEK